MKKLIFISLGIGLFLLNTPSFSMEGTYYLRVYPSGTRHYFITHPNFFADPERAVIEMEPINSEEERKEAIKLIEENSLDIPQEDKNIIQSMLSGHYTGEHIGILFHGPKGTGKTSMAKKIAKMLGGGTFFCQDSLPTEKGYLQRFIQEKIEETIIHQQRKRTYIFDEANRLVKPSTKDKYYDPEFNGGKKPAEMVYDLLQKVKKINEERGNQDIRIIATANDTTGIPPEIASELRYIEINFPEFERRAIYFNDLITRVAGQGANLSICNKEAMISAATRKTAGLPIRELRKIDGLLFGSFFKPGHNNQQYFREKYLRNAVKYICDQAVFPLQKKERWIERIYDYLRDDVRFYLFENNAAFFVKHIFIKALAFSGIRRFLNISRPFFSPLSFFSYKKIS